MPDNRIHPFYHSHHKELSASQSKAKKTILGRLLAFFRRVKAWFFPEKNKISVQMRNFDTNGSHSTNDKVNSSDRKNIYQRQVKSNKILSLPVLNSDDYENLGKLGEGNFGQVYKVKHKASKKIFALKIVGTDKDLRDECAAMLRIQRKDCIRYHKNLIHIVGMSPGKSEKKYILMEFWGKSLKKNISRFKSYQPSKIKTFFYQIVQGAAAIELAGYEHHDIKPDNILTNGDKELKLCDFGVARKKGFISLNGSKMYMPVEKFSEYKNLTKKVFTYENDKLFSSALAGKSDSWALGCIFAEMVLGERVMDPILIEKRNSKDEFESIILDTEEKCKERFKEISTKIEVKMGVEAAELFDKLTDFDPVKRITPTAAMQDLYFN